MLTRSGVLTFACALALTASATVTSAQTIPVTAHVTADNHYALYVGNADGTELTFIGRNEYGYWGSPGTYNWSLPETWTFDIREDQYIYIAAWDESTSPSVSMLRADFQSPLAVLVTDVEQWRSAPIPSSSPGDYGDADPDDIRAAITAGGWVKPVQKEAGTSTTWSGYPAVPGILPEAFYIWHSPNAPHVLFRASAAYLLYPPPPTCEEQLAEAQAEIARLDANLATCSGDLATCQTSLTQTTASLTLCSADLASTQAALTAATADADADGIPDRFDTCPGTATGAAVDATGCSLAQFCGRVIVAAPKGQALCQALDWRNDEPLMRGPDRDCRVVLAAGTPAQLRRCVPVESPQ